MKRSFCFKWAGWRSKKAKKWEDRIRKNSLHEKSIRLKSSWLVIIVIKKKKLLFFILLHLHSDNSNICVPNSILFFSLYNNKSLFHKHLFCTILSPSFKVEKIIIIIKSYFFCVADSCVMLQFENFYTQQQ